MAPTYELIASNTLGSNAATVTFSAIPATYTDLVLRISARTDRVNVLDQMRITFNSDTGTNYSYISLVSDSSAGSSQISSNANYSANYYINGNSATSDTFGSAEIYIPNYAGSTNKPLGGFSVQENNNATAYLGVVASLWRDTSAISSIDITKIGTNFVTNSSFFLYGIKNS